MQRITRSLLAIFIFLAGFAAFPLRVDAQNTPVTGIPVPWGSGSTLPATCDPTKGDGSATFFKTGGGSLGFYWCSASNTWSQGAAGSGITSLNGLSGTTQVFASANDTNITLTITSTGTTHTFTMGWTSTLAGSRGGWGQALPTPTRSGDIFYYNGTTWTTLAGNNSTAACLGEDSGGVPSWTTCSGGGGGGITNPAANGLVVCTGTSCSTSATVSIAGTSPITITNGSGVSGNPTVACATCATAAAAVTSNQLVIGGGGQAIAALGSAGTTVQVLHGNASGPPSYSAVVLTTDVSGQLPVANGGTGTGSTLTGLVRGGSSYTAAELSGDATTSGSNSVSVVALHFSGTGISLGTAPTSGQCLSYNGTNITGASCSGLTNPMTTAADMIIGGSSGTPTRLAGPTGINGVPYMLVSTASGGVAGTETWALAGVPTNNNSETTCNGSGSGQTLNILDRATAIFCSGTTTSTFTFPVHTTTGFGSSFPFLIVNNNSGKMTLTPTTDTIDNASLYPNWADWLYNNSSGNWQTIQVPQFAAFGSTCSNGLTWTSTNGTFSCLSAAPILTGGTAGGDLSGTYPNPTVAQVNGVAVPASAAALATNSSRQLVAATAIPLSVLATQSADTVVANATGSSAVPTAVAFPTTGTNGCAGSTDTLIYNTSTHSLACHQITTSGVALSSLLNAAGTTTLSNANNPQTWNWAQTTNSQSAMTFGETTAATGTSDIELNIQTLASSTAEPIQITARGTANGVAMTAAGGILGQIGTGGFGIGSTAHGVLVSEGATTAAVATAAGTSGQALLSGGASADPAYAALNLGGGSSIVTGTLPAANVASIPLNQVISATGAITTLANGNNPLTLNWAQTTNSQSAVTIGETTAATGTSDIELNVQTLASSTAEPIQITARGTANGVAMTAAGGILGQIGSGGFGIGSTAHGVLISEGATTAAVASAAGTAHQLFVSGGASADPSYQDAVDHHIIPLCASPGGTASPGVSYASGQWTPTNRAGTNNTGCALQAIPNTGATLQFLFELPFDWDTATQPYINANYASGANTSGTVIWTVSSGCVDVSTNGGASDDPTFHAESAFATQTMANANRMWYQNGQFTAMTSANGCKVGSPVIFKVVLSGTATSAINLYQITLTVPRLPVVQAN